MYFLSRNDFRTFQLKYLKVTHLVDMVISFLFQALLVGDNEGLVTIYQMREMPPKQEFTVSSVERFWNILIKCTMDLLQGVCLVREKSGNSFIP